MEIEEVFIGGWFQRTTLHLTEVYDFLSRAESELELDAVRLQEMRRALELHKVERKNWLLEYVEAIVSTGLKFRMYEDGLIVLEKNVTGELKQNLEDVRKYYNEKLAPALSYLFSKGAPVPKELAKITSLLPFILVARNANKEEVAAFFKEKGSQIYAAIEAPQATVYKSSKVIVIVSRNTPEKIRQLVEGQIFFREFKAQLHSYLRIHRKIWEEIAVIKERGKIKGTEIRALRTKLDAYQKTIKLIESRINQMSSYLRTRGKIYASQKIDEALDQIFSYKYETLEDTLSYIKELWKMTDNYLSATLARFGEIGAESTRNSISSLRLITTVGVIAGIIGYLGRDALPQVTWRGGLFFLILLVATWAVNELVALYYSRKNYALKKEVHEMRLLP